MIHCYKMRKLKPLYLVLFVSVVLLVCLLLHCPCNPVKENSWLPISPTNLGNRNLEQVLRKASMPDRTVILTVVNETWARPGSVLDLFLKSFEIGIGTKRFLNHLIIVAADSQSFQYCKSIHPHCFHLTTTGINFSSEKKFMSDPYYLRLGWKRIELLLEVLQLGYHFVYTDADLMWLRNPFLHFNPVDELMIAREFYAGDPESRNNRADGGFLYVKSNAMSIEFFRYWYMARILHPNSNDQSVFEIITRDGLFENMGLRIKYLDPTYFSNFCQPSEEMNQVCTVHANCCDSTESKLHDLRLVLDDWRIFTATSNETNSLQGSSVASSLSWKAPSKCKG